MRPIFDQVQREIDEAALRTDADFGWNEPGDGYCIVTITLGQRIALQWWHEAHDLQWARA